MNESAKLRGFHDFSMVNLSIMAKTLWLKDNQNKNEIIEEIINYLVEIVLKCSKSQS